MPIEYDEARPSVLSLLTQAVDAVPDRVFLDFSGQTFTYGAAYAQVLSIAQGFRESGVKAGDTVGGMLDNNPVAIFAWMAANALGATWVGINTALKGDFLHHVLEEADVRLLLAQPEHVERIRRLEGRVGLLEQILFLGDEAVDAGPYRGGLVEDILLEPSEEGLELAPDPFGLTCLVVTGGTTGPSKCCMIEHAYLCNFARQVNEISARQPDEVSLNPLPAYHMNLLSNTVVSSLLVQGTGAVLPRFSLSGFWPEVERTGARVVNLLGSMISLVAQQADTPESLRCKDQVRAVVGAPFPAELQRIWRKRFGIEIAGLNGYGLTEAVAITSVPAGEYAKPGTAGRANDDFEVKIFDDDDRELPVGSVGEIVCRPKRPGVMFSGYWKRPDATLAAMRNLWFHTGDLGMYDEDGFLNFVDRKKDYLRRRGENISSMELEATFMKHDAIAEVAAHAVPSDLTEDDVKVTIVLKPGHVLSEADLFGWSVDLLPYFALPRYIEIRPELPKSPLGRVYKFELREEGVTPATWDRELADVTFEKR